jgi:hypothetical protein
VFNLKVKKGLSVPPPPPPPPFFSLWAAVNMFFLKKKKKKKKIPLLIITGVGLHLIASKTLDVYEFLECFTNHLNLVKLVFRFSPTPHFFFFFLDTFSYLCINLYNY